MDRRQSKSGFWRGFGFAIDGISYAIAWERNMKIHVGAAILVLVVALIVRPPLPAVVISVLTMVVVMSLELVNTAIERIVDAVAGEQRLEFAQIAKDTAAGAVLLGALASLAAGYYIVASTYPWQWRLTSGVHPAGAVISALTLLVIVLLWVHSQVFHRKIRHGTAQY